MSKMHYLTCSIFNVSIRDIKRTGLSSRHAVGAQVGHDKVVEHLRERLHEPRAILGVEPGEVAGHHRICD